MIRDTVIDKREITEEALEIKELILEELSKIESDSLYLENSNRGDIDNGTYLKLGEPMEFYFKKHRRRKIFIL